MHTKTFRILALLGCAAAFLLLFCFTVRASQTRGVLDNRLLMSDVWFQVTLIDTYLGFMFAFAWVAWKEHTAWLRLMWFVLIMVFGNMAVAVYVMIQILRLPSGGEISDLFQRRSRS